MAYNNPKGNNNSDEWDNYWNLNEDTNSTPDTTDDTQTTDDSTVKDGDTSSVSVTPAEKNLVAEQSAKTEIPAGTSSVGSTTNNRIDTGQKIQTGYDVLNDYLMKHLPNQTEAKGTPGTTKEDDGLGWYRDKAYELWGEGTEPEKPVYDAVSERDAYHRNTDAINEIASKLMSQEERDKRMRSASQVEAIQGLGNVFSALSGIYAAKGGAKPVDPVGDYKPYQSIKEFADKWEKKDDAVNEAKAKATATDAKEYSDDLKAIRKSNEEKRDKYTKRLDYWKYAIRTAINKNNQAQQKAEDNKAKRDEEFENKKELTGQKHQYTMEEIKARGAQNRRTKQTASASSRKPTYDTDTYTYYDNDGTQHKVRKNIPMGSGGKGGKRHINF